MRFELPIKEQGCYPVDGNVECDLVKEDKIVKTCTTHGGRQKFAEKFG